MELSGLMKVAVAMPMGSYIHRMSLSHLLMRQTVRWRVSQLVCVCTLLQQVIRAWGLIGLMPLAFWVLDCLESERRHRPCAWPS